jgi:glycosyltransferase involved in cell wall biosynthesis
VRLAILNLTGGGLSGGYRKYLTEMVPRLEQVPEVSRLDVFVPAGAGVDLRTTRPHCRVRRFEAGRGGWRALRAELAAAAPDVVFVPTSRWLRVDGVPTVVMVRNMEPLEPAMPGTSVQDRVRNLLRAFAFRHACRRATRVIAVSEHVRQFLTGRWALPAAKVGLVYHGVDAPGPETAPIARDDRLPSSFILTAGSIRPYRGLEDLVGAMPALAARGVTLPLVIAGQADKWSGGYEKRIRRLAAQLNVSDRVVWAGHLDAHRLAACFERCAAFVTTSRIEACPNVALEAMSHGAQCVSVDAPPMPEFFATAARYYPRGDAGALARAIAETVAAPEEHRRERRQMALSRAACFTWERTLHETIRQLELARS